MNRQGQPITWPTCVGYLAQLFSYDIATQAQGSLPTPMGRDMERPTLFSAFLDELQKSSLPANALQEIQANKIKLAGMPVPAGVDPATSASIKTALSQAFVYGFRVIMFVCAALSMASAAMTWLMIGDNRS